MKVDAEEAVSIIHHTPHISCPDTCVVQRGWGSWLVNMKAKTLTKCSKSASTQPGTQLFYTTSLSIS